MSANIASNKAKSNTSPESGSTDTSKDKSAIYADLNELRRLKYLAKGFSLYPKSTSQ